MLYTITYHQPHKHIIDIQLTIQNIYGDSIHLQLPAWRPGRYTIANFAKNILKIAFKDNSGKNLKFRKVTKDRWEVDTMATNQVVVNYMYYARQMDGGGSWLDEDQLYLNFINCMLYVEGRLNEPCTIKLSLPPDYRIACGLDKGSQHKLEARDYYQLVDSPMIASSKLKRLEYEAAGSKFYLWIMGDWEPDKQKILSQFRAFTHEQISTMGDFPSTEYHFMYQILPYPHYHGVEHQNSTIITLGPSEKMNGDALYKNFLGVSSHELFHTWNVIRIRPAEMIPYDFSKENYFKTGFIAEGITTYYGDLFLVRCKVFSVKEYFDNLNKLFKRHLDNFGRTNLSVADSSYDLWLDGYEPGIPNRKSSIYIEGAVAALILDLTIRKVANGKKSLDDVMRLLWEEYGKTNTGYSMADYQKAAEAIAGLEMKDYFEDFIFGNAPTENKLNEVLNYVGCQLSSEDADTDTERLFGFKTIQKENLTVVSAIQPESIADQFLTLHDEIIAVNGRKINNNLNEVIDGKQKIELAFFRNHQLRKVELFNEGQKYYMKRKIEQIKGPTKEQALQFEKWLGWKWDRV